MSNTLPPSLGRKYWDTWFLNSSKSKTRLKFMKLCMLSWSGINTVVQILSHLGQVWVYASHNPELLTTSMMVSDRTPVCKMRVGFVHLLNTNGSFGWPVWTTYKQFGKIFICHIGYVAICQTRKIDICWSSNIAICQPCNTAICQNMKLNITSSI